MSCLVSGTQNLAVFHDNFGVKGQPYSPVVLTHNSNTVSFYPRNTFFKLYRHNRISVCELSSHRAANWDLVLTGESPARKVLLTPLLEVCSECTHCSDCSHQILEISKQNTNCILIYCVISVDVIQRGLSHSYNKKELKQNIRAAFKAIKWIPMQMTEINSKNADRKRRNKTQHLEQRRPNVQRTTA